MSNQFNKITIIDIEATCWEKTSKQDYYEKSEIIEFGCALLDVKTGQILDNCSIYVKPTWEWNQKLSDCCINLTGITDDLLKKQGKSFESAIIELKNRFFTSKTWMSWGAFDKRFLRRKCEQFDLSFPFKDGMHINAKNLFTLMSRKLTRSVGMKKAMEMLNLELEGQHHSGKDDAYNIAKIVRKILWEDKDILVNSKGMDAK